MHADFEDSGTIAALIRLCEAMGQDDFAIPDLPVWLFENRMPNCAGTYEWDGPRDATTVEEAVQVLPALVRLERALHAANDGIVADDADDAAGQAQARDSVLLVCMARMQLGACCEAYAALAASRLAAPGACVASRDEAEMARLYSDAMLVATWTSAHATYLHTVRCSGVDMCAPSIHLVPSAVSEFDLSDLYARRTASSTSSLASKDAGHMLALMMRCTNPGSRGWDSVVKQALEKSPGVRRLCTRALSISLLGMHAGIHPAIRMRWKERLVLQELFAHLVSQTTASTLIMSCVIEFKECVRRMTSNCTSSAYATIAALQHVDHPLALLLGCPFQMPRAGAEAAAVAFVEAGRHIAATHGEVDVAACIKRAFVAQTACDGHLAWNASFLGKGTASVKRTYSNNTPPSRTHTRHASFWSFDGMVPLNNLGWKDASTLLTYSSWIAMPFSWLSFGVMA